MHTPVAVHALFSHLALNADIVNGVALAISQGGHEELVPKSRAVGPVVEEAHARVVAFVDRLFLATFEQDMETIKF